jgi:predicted nuclease with TOPRIM domain
MSDEPTKDIAEKYDTKPTIETVLERINALGEQLNARVDRLEEQLDIRLDRIESEVKLTHSEVYALRADFKELKSDLKVHESR